MCFSYLHWKPCAEVLSGTRDSYVLFSYCKVFSEESLVPDKMLFLALIHPKLAVNI